MSTSLQDLSAAASAIVAQIARSTVSIESRRTRSSGFVWRSGLIVTADDALPDEEELHVVLLGGRRSAATFVGRDPTTDLALLRISDIAPEPIPLAADVPAVGTMALAVGSRSGSATAALGVVSLNGPGWQSVRGGDIDSRIELDLRLRRDAEGGVAVTADGRACGMVVFGPRRRVLVIPTATITRVAGALEQKRRVARGYLGLGLQPVSAEVGGSGVMVRAWIRKARARPRACIKGMSSCAGMDRPSRACVRCCARWAPTAWVARSPSTFRGAALAKSSNCRSGRNPPREHGSPSSCHLHRRSGIGAPGRRPIVGTSRSRDRRRR